MDCLEKFSDNDPTSHQQPGSLACRLVKSVQVDVFQMEAGLLV